MAGLIRRRNVTLCTSQIRQKGTIGEAIGGKKSCGRKRLNGSRPCGEAGRGRRFIIQGTLPNRSLRTSEVRPRRAPALSSGPPEAWLTRHRNHVPATELGLPGEADTQHRGKVHPRWVSGTSRHFYRGREVQRIAYEHFSPDLFLTTTEGMSRLHGGVLAETNADSMGQVRCAPAHTDRQGPALGTVAHKYSHNVGRHARSQATKYVPMFQSTTGQLEQRMRFRPSSSPTRER